MMTRRSNGGIFVVVLVIASTGCGVRTADETKSGRANKANTVDRSSGRGEKDTTPDETLIMLAAASTKDAVEELAARFEQKTGTTVRISAGPSNALATQIAAGAPADLFLSANEKWAHYVQEQGFADAVKPLLSNGLALIVPRSNPAGVQSPTDLAGRRVERVALAGENVPAGIYAEQALRDLALFDLLAGADKIVRGQDVRATLNYVARGEVDAGIVYDTDARVDNNVIVVDRFNPKSYDRIVYPLVLVKRGPARAAAQRLYDFLGSAEAAAVFEHHGFIFLSGGAP